MFELMAIFSPRQPMLEMPAESIAQPAHWAFVVERRADAGSPREVAAQPCCLAVSRTDWLLGDTLVTSR
jgi:hypothetical protein